jgi:hypothetical protein
MQPANKGVDVEGYEVVTNDEHKVGRVVAVSGDMIVVEHGSILKRRNALPRELVHVDDDARVVRATISKDVFSDSPKVEGDRVDTRAVASYYGLARGFDAPSTQGYGDVVPDETARSAEEDAQRLDVGAPTQERASIRAKMSDAEGALDRGSSPSPGVTGGDRFADAPPGRD